MQKADSLHTSVGFGKIVCSQQQNVSRFIRRKISDNSIGIFIMSKTIIQYSFSFSRFSFCDVIFSFFFYPFEFLCLLEEIFGGEGGARSFHIDEVREIKESLWLAPNESEQKVYVLLNIENMTQEAQNALLKSLEEPPAHARFILTCDNRRSLLDTIISRSTVYTLEPPTREECAAALRENFPELSEKDAELFSIAYGGNFGAASAGVSEGMGETVLLAAKTPELLRKGESYVLAAELSAN